MTASFGGTLPSADHESKQMLTPRSSVDFTRGLSGVNSIANGHFSLAVVLFFVVLMLLTFILRLWKIAQAELRHLIALGHSREKQNLFMHNRGNWWPWVKRHVVYAPIFGKRHNRELQISSVVNVGTLPSRFHSALLLAYISTNIAYCVKLDYSQATAACWAELRGRAGELATLNLIFCVLFAIKNSPLIWILRVSYDTFNLLHRWTARIVILEAVLHTVAWFVNSAELNGWKATAHSLTQSPFISWGTVGTASLLIILLQAWGPIRHAFYEVFVNAHRLLALAAILGTHIHLEKGQLPQTTWIKIVWGLWIFEFVFRLARIFWFNISRHARTKVTIEAMPSEACRVTFDLVRPWTFSPGAHVHVWFPSFWSSFMSSHPFSVAWTEQHTIAGEFSEKLPTSEKDLDSPDKTRTSVSLVLRARTGLTRRMFEKASKAPMKTISVWGLLEGPYGGHESLDSYGTALLFAGGVGITHQINFIKHLVRGCEEGTTATRKVVLVWSVPNTEALEWVRPWMDEILKMKGRREVLKIMLFITKPKSQQEVISGTGTVQMFPGRCSPQAIIDKEILDRVGAMCVTVCGPGAFADSVRQATRRRVQVGQIDFVEEAFTY